MLEYFFLFDPFKKNKKKRGVSYLYRTATTSYLCYVPVLEESEGAGRTRLTPVAKVMRNLNLMNSFKEN